MKGERMAQTCAFHAVRRLQSTQEATGREFISNEHTSAACGRSAVHTSGESRSIRKHKIKANDAERIKSDFETRARLKVNKKYDKEHDVS